MPGRLSAVIVVLFCAVLLQAQNKQDISVLYVGYGPDREMPEYRMTGSGGMSEERFREEYPKRMPSFMNYLEKYFSEVAAIDARDYKSKDSDNYDVTIFDQTPSPVTERIYERDSLTGKTLRYEPPTYVEKHFSRPSVFIGHTADRVGRSLGSKLDWYCLCLTKWAHSIKTSHQIFKGPFQVDITLENRPTPSPIFHYPGGVDMPAEIPMWTVNTEDYTEERGFRVGLVARGWGFEDSPDAEVISSGQCDKDKSAVALGRHGNFFLWGFAGSPDYMTDEAKQVFANVIVYIHQHADEKIFVRKYNDRIATKEFIEDLLYYLTPESYYHHVEVYEGIYKSSLEAKKKAEEKQDAGEELNEMEKMMLNFEPQPIKTREQYLEKQFLRLSWGEEVGLDTLKIRKYLEENRDYFYSEPDGFYDLIVDEDIKSLGIANTDIRVLDAAIQLLEQNRENEKAHRILQRYTLEGFTTAGQWRAWYDKHRDNMFFTEAGGFVWMINDPDANPDVRPRNDDELNDKPEPEVKLNEPTHAEPVSVGAAIIPGSDDSKRRVVIRTNIMEGYHIYAYVPSNEVYIQTELGLELPEGVKRVGEWEKPSPAPFPGKQNLLVYKNRGSFSQEIELGENVAKGTILKCWLYYQCCDSRICFKPERKEFELIL